MDSELRMRYRWGIIAVLAAPVLGLFGYSLVHPGIRGKDDRIFPAVVQAKPVAAAVASPWVMQDSGTNAGLRGIYSVSSMGGLGLPETKAGTIAWASGTNGTVLETIDGGNHWMKCQLPDVDASGLDFRGIQAWDARTAVVLASGPGEKSRIYKTKDSCHVWNLLIENREKDAFWDVLALPGWRFHDAPPLPSVDDGLVIGDPRLGYFDTLKSSWDKPFKRAPGCAASEGDGAFAASNSSVAVLTSGSYLIGSGGKTGASVLIGAPPKSAKTNLECRRVSVPMAGGSESSGIFSLSFRDDEHGLAVGGNYTKPNDGAGTAAWTADGGLHWTAAVKPPHGYRSSVAWSDELKAWIAAGTNGSDISRDDGKTWAPLDDGNWNALSLPFVVGPKGRIARLNAAALK